MRKNTLDRFWDKVDVQGPNECWLWIGGKDKYGYGRFVLTNRGKIVQAHRFTYEMLVGRIPKELEIDHLCRVTSCVNPRHLEAVTHWVNTMRGDTLAAKYRAQTACKNGHTYTEASTTLVLQLNGQLYKHCKPCAVKNTRAYLARKAARV